MMPNVRVAPSSFAEEPEESGARVVTVWVPDAGNVDVVFSEAEAIALVQSFQRGFLDRQGKRTITPSYPTLTVTDANIAHGAKTSGLLLTTAEVGSVALTFESPVGRRLIDETNRALAESQQRAAAKN